MQIIQLSKTQHHAKPRQRRDFVIS